MAWARSICRQERICVRPGGVTTARDASTLLRVWARGAATRRIAGFVNLAVLLLMIASQAPNAGPEFSVHASMLALPPEAFTVALIATSALTSLLLVVGYERGETVNKEDASAAATTTDVPPAEVNGILEQMGHDLRTPLNAIIGFSDMMQQQMHGPLGSDRYQDYAEHIRESGVALLATIECTLTLTQNLVERSAVDATALQQSGPSARGSDWSG